MTRRITIAILATVWTMLIVGGLIAYFTTRSILLENMDMSLKNRAISMLESPATPVIGSERMVAKDDSRRLSPRVMLKTWDAKYHPQITAAYFSRTADARLRTVMVRCYTPSGDAGEPRPLTTTISDSAAPFDALMNRLAVTLCIFGLAAGLITAGVAAMVSRAALRPLKSTAEQVGAIDERKLDRRIDAAKLPAELLPMAERLNEMLARLQTAFELRNRFMADASHELRTPVASLMMTLDIALSRPRGVDHYRTTLETCREDARQLRKLVERLMELVRSQNLSHDELAEPTDLAKLLNQCADNIRPLAEVKGLAITRSFDRDVRGLVCPNRFRSIVMNLLGNAVEYNRPGGQIELVCSRDFDSLSLRVKDTGIGIPTEHVPHLFEPFYRADAARQQETGHLGLGLTLVDGHVRAMMGTCRVFSEPSVGTTFDIRIPQPAQADPSPEVLSGASGILLSESEVYHGS